MAVQLGFLGAGLVAGIHRHSLGAVAGDVTWAGVYDTERERAARFAADTGASICGSAQEVLERAEAVYVCTWTSEHPGLVEQAAAMGVAIYCEKPLAVSLALAEAMAAHVTHAGVVNQTGLVLRHSPAFHWLRRLIDDPRSGRVMSIAFRDDQYLPVGGYYDSTWRADQRRAGAGVLLEHSIHDIDIMELLCGPIGRVSCQTAAFHGLPGIEDVATVRIEFASGVPGTLTTVWHDIGERGNERRVEVFCENLWCVLDGNHHHGPVSWQWRGEHPRTADARQLLRLLEPSALEDHNPDAAFIASVQGRRPAYPGFAIALRAHQLVDAAYRSAAAGGTVTDVGR